MKEPTKKVVNPAIAQDLTKLANMLTKTLVEPIKYDRRLIDLGYKPKSNNKANK